MKPNPRQDAGVVPCAERPVTNTQHSPPPFDHNTFERNLQALAFRSPSAVRDIRAAQPSFGVTFLQSDDNHLIARLENSGGRLLASARAADTEGKRLADSVDIKASAAIVVRGFGVGHHLRHLAHRIGATGLIICFEPDVSLLRDVLGRIDCTHWFNQSRFILITRANESGPLAAGLEGLEGLVAAGVTLVDHPPSKLRLGTTGETFANTLTTVIKGVRTNVITTLAHSELTLRNLMGNASVYLHAPGVADLKDCQKHRPAIVVSAGPSLRRNIDLLQTPGIRDRVVIVAAQTVLKQLLSKGIKPHFVTALDYHEISTRFYEGLTKEDVEGITLVVEPKANCAILRAFPGIVRCVQDDTLTRVLGKSLAREMGQLPLGATVAHLSYYLARYLGCDPVLLIGQDLGFTDGQYYSPGAAIHQVWSAELNDFCSLEMLEWQRIMRMRSHLRKTLDQQGRPVYTDEQMATYLLQFERDFLRDKDAGKTTIDATEGGVLKKHTRIMPLREALEQLSILQAASNQSTVATTAPLQTSTLDISFTADVAPAAEAPLAPTQPLAAFPKPSALPDQRDALCKRLEKLSQECETIKDACPLAIEDLNKMLKHHGDQALVSRLIDRVQKRAAEVTSLEANWLVQHLNQTGQLNRFKADRAIELDDSLSALDKQRKQIERDIQNITWLRESASSAAEMLADALVATKTGVAPTRSATPQSADLAEQTGVDGRRRNVWACIWVDHHRSAMGPRSLKQEVCFAGKNHSSILAATLDRLSNLKELDGVLLITNDKEQTTSLLARFKHNTNTPVRVHTVTELQSEQIQSRLNAVRAARLWSRHSWRTGVANMSAYDELLHPAIWNALARQYNIDAALLVGADWIAVDPHTTDATIARYREAPRRHAFCFSQAGVGLAGAVASSDVLSQLAGFTHKSESDPANGARTILGTLGQLVGYHPRTPQLDPIAKPFCVQVPPAMRDMLVRCTWDDANFRAFVEHASQTNLSLSTGSHVASAFSSWLASNATKLPEVLELNVSAHNIEETASIAARLKIASHASSDAGQPLALTIHDAAGTGPWRELASLAKPLGFAGVHIRTSHEHITRTQGESLVDAMDLGVDVVSIDMPGDTPATWLARTNSNSIEQCWESMQHALDERAKRSSTCLPRTWFVPRLTRCDATYEDIESFVDRWMLTAGSCSLDAPTPLDAPNGSRIEALPLPANVLAKRAWSRVCVGANSLVTPIPTQRLLPEPPSHIVSAI